MLDKKNIEKGLDMSCPYENDNLINVIEFISTHPANNLDDKNRPIAAKSYLPQWYKEKDKYVKKEDGFYALTITNLNNKQVVERIPTWKSCPAILDIFTSGYYFLTPCDINIDIENGEYKVSIPEEWHGPLERFDRAHGKAKFTFCGKRGKEDGFPTPDGYEETHFFWIPNWVARVPKNYTILHTHPLNRFDLPFLTINGFIDCSEENVSTGRIPFFIKSGFTGIIPAGTPYLQVIPIKNEAWQSNIIEYSAEEIINNNHKKINEEFTGHTKNNYKTDYWLNKDYQ